MNNLLKDNEIKIDDFNETLLNVNESSNENIKKVKDTDEKETDLATFITRNKWQVYKDIANIFTERSKNDNELKEKYSKKLIKILVFQLILMNIIFILGGTGILNYSDTTFNIFVTATIAEVFSLVTIIVKYLFTDNLTKLLSNILTDVKDDKKEN